MAGPLYNLKQGVTVAGDITAASGDIATDYQVAAANGAITIPARGRKFVFITKGTAAAMTLAAPTATTHDGVEIIIMCTTAAAHTVTATTIGFNALDAAGDVCTFTAAVGNYIGVVAYQGEWYVTRNLNGTLA